MGVMTAGRKEKLIRMTIRLDAHVARWLRARATKRHATVSSVLEEALKTQMREDAAYDAAMRKHFEMVKPVMFEKPGGRFPTRDELYDRPKRWS